jgi:very-short-patch-repair endonuclease
LLQAARTLRPLWEKVAAEGGRMRGRKSVQDKSPWAMARPATIPQARALRRSAPETERLLWKLLRDRRLEGMKFRRQAPLGPFVLDFVCLRHRLVIEADGPFHDPEQDAVRDAWLVAKGFRVLRFSNAEIQLKDWKVVARILGVVGAPLLQS